MEKKSMSVIVSVLAVIIFAGAGCAGSANVSPVENKVESEKTGTAEADIATKEQQNTPSGVEAETKTVVTAPAPKPADPPVSPARPADCKTDYACLKAKAGECEMGKGSIMYPAIDQNSTEFQLQFTTTVDIKGKTDTGACKIVHATAVKGIVTENARQKLKSEGVTDQEIEEETAAAAKLWDPRATTCSGANSAVVSFVASLKEDGKWPKITQIPGTYTIGELSCEL